MNFMQNDFHQIKPYERPTEKENFIKANKKMIGVLVVICAGVLVGGILKIKSNGQVQGVSTEATSEALSLVNPVPTIATVSPSPTFIPVDTLDPNAEGAELPTATIKPTLTPTPTPSPTPTLSPTTAPSTYNATISSVNSNGSLSATVTVSVTKDGNADCGETVTLAFDNTNANVNSNSDCINGDTTFNVTATQAGTYTATAQVYGQSYGTAQVVFN